MKFYSDYRSEIIDNRGRINSPSNYYDIFHNYFYFSLLPKNLKYKFLSQLNKESFEVFKDILKIPLEFSSNINECDFIVSYIPTNCFKDFNYDFKYTKKLIRLSFEHKKKLILFYGDDYDSEFSFLNESSIRNNPKIIIFRSSWIKSDNFLNIFSCPTLSQDFFSGKYMKKDLKVGFCGWNKNPNDNFRENILNSLLNKEGFNFIFRDRWGDIKKEDFYTSINKNPPKNSQKEFIQNIEENLYTICVRGGGNFSFRLLETFMMGRIPVLIDTDCLLPFEDKIPYKKNTVYINQKNSNNFQCIKELIENYHHSHTEEELLNIQYENRKIWEEYFTLTGSFYNTLDLIKTIHEKV